MQHKNGGETIIVAIATDKKESAPPLTNEADQTAGVRKLPRRLLRFCVSCSAG